MEFALWDVALKWKVQSTYVLSSLQEGLGCMLYLWSSLEKKAAVDMHLVVPGGRVGVHVVFVA